ncbi:hypothetical protein J1N35_043255 [Gossypium stocksii]|uniref:Uncharacterized protein n=1 Tax=Gossypium stocksii TaxID=47602 RepID=A0A9D3U748_9ROSI|nr:hypothetical protein J1N35_043255 [Gossypium stocksii]
MDMQSNGNLSRSSNSPSMRVPLLLPPLQSQQSLRRLNLCSQIATHSSPIVFLKKRTNKPKAFSKRSEASITDNQTEKRKNVPNDNNNSTVEKDSSNDTAYGQVVAAKLTSKALVWGSHVLPLDDVVSVSYNVGVRHFTMHSYPLKKGACGFSDFIKPKRSQKDFRFLASSVEEAVQ